MIQLKDLTLGYEQRTLLEKVSAHITGGQLVALLGRTGTEHQLRHHRQSAHCQPAMQRRRRTGTCSLYQLARSAARRRQGEGGQRHAPGRHGQLCGKDDGQNVRRRMPTHHDSPCPCTGHSCHPARRTYRLP